MVPSDTKSSSGASGSFMAKPKARKGKTILTQTKKKGY